MPRGSKEQPPVTTPTSHLVEEAIARFDAENKTCEQALAELFSHYHANDKPAHVLLKVVALDRLYSTHLPNVYDVTDHIYQQAPDVDAALAVGSPDVVDRIANITTGAKPRANYSFASKYCSWHNQAAYPIWDLCVRTYFLKLRSQNPSLPFPRPEGYLWDHYHEFLALVTGFRDYCGLQAFTFKQIDKFLYQEGGEPSRYIAVNA